MCIEPLTPHAQRGLTLIELVVFIVVVSIGLAGILSVLNYTTGISANPMLMKQQVAIAESLLEEIESKSFTWCDPSDPAVTTANQTVDCAIKLSLGPKSKNRYDPTNPFTSVADYDGLNMSPSLTPPGIRSPSDGSSSSIAGLENYSAIVTITPLTTAFVETDLGDDAPIVRLDVEVGAPGQPAITLTGYRYLYAPNVP